MKLRTNVFCVIESSPVYSLQRHERGHLVGYVPPANTLNCRHCGIGLRNYAALFEHSKTMHPTQTGRNVNIPDHQTSSQSALEDSAYILTIYPSDEDKYDLLTFFLQHSSKNRGHSSGEM